MSTWILLRGLGRESRHWGDFPDILRRELMHGDNAAPARILSPDLAGNGTRNAQRSPCRIETMADDLRARLLAEGVPPPYHLLALSLGAMVAVAWAQQHPLEVRGAVLINTSLRPFSPMFERLRPENYRRLLPLPLIGDAERENIIHALTSRHPQHRAEIVDAWIHLRRDRPVTTANLLRQLLAAARFRAPDAKPSPPLLILASKQDALVNSACSHALARHWQCPLVEHADAGHDLPLDDGAWVAAVVADRFADQTG